MNHLPMGWREVPAVGIPDDAGTPEDEWESTAKPKLPRQELRRWVRGRRYIRICVELEDGKPSSFKLHYGMIDRDNDKWHRGDTGMSSLLVHARTLMRIGGYPT